MCRRTDLRRFYGLMQRLERKKPGRLVLGEVESPDCPARGVYFFFEGGERRSGSGTGDRVVRVGSHALRAHQMATLWDRIYKHKRADQPTRWQRGSVFRDRVGNAICHRNRRLGPRHWPTDRHRGDAVRIEGLMNEHMWPMTMLLLPVGPRSDRNCIEQNAIALLSEYARKDPIDLASDTWLGRHCDREEVRESGLWQSRHVAHNYNPKFLDFLEDYVDRAGG